MQPWATISAIRDPRYAILANCRLSTFRGTSTSVENPLQISSFYAKQTQFPKSEMNVNPYNTSDYENKSNWTLGQNKPNSNPISKQLVGARPGRPESAKMAQRVANRGVIKVQAESIKKTLKKPNLLKIKMLSCSHCPIPATGTPFAHLEYMR
jgi:hypothetical protein